MVFMCSACTTQTIGIVQPQAAATPTKNTSPLDSKLSSTATIDNFTITNHLTPITLNVNVIILTNDQKKHSNFDWNNAEEKSLVQDYFEKINEVWSHFYQPDNLTGCYTGTDFYNDSKIRFKFNYITYEDATAWNYKNSGANIEKKNYSGISPYEGWYLKNLDQKFSNDPSIPKGILVYLTMDGENFDRFASNNAKGYNIAGVEASQFPTTTNLTRTSSIHIPNRYLKYLYHRYQLTTEYKTNWQETRKWHVNDAVGSAHEFGHTMGLEHSNQYHKANQCKYALMSQTGSDPRNYLQPTEILKAHKNLRESNLIQFVTENSFLGNTFLIPQHTTWTKTQRFYSHLKVADNVTLTITEPIIIAPQAKITFGKNAKIIFEKNGKITYPNGKEFTGYVNKYTDTIIKN